MGGTCIRFYVFIIILLSIEVNRSGCNIFIDAIAWFKTELRDNCPAGQYSHQWHTSGRCWNCAAGSFQPDRNQDHCNPCSPGMYQNEVGKLKCHNCVPGSVQPHTGQTRCEICPITSFANSKNICVPCPRFPKYVGNTLTLTTAVQTGASSSAECYVNCARGKFYEPISRRCINCRPGTYSLYGVQPHGACKPCLAGRYISLEGSSGCRICLKGTFSKQRSSWCTKCPNGYYQDKTEQASCTSCPSGKTTANSGSSSIEDCKEVALP